LTVIGQFLTHITSSTTSTAHCRPRMSLKAYYTNCKPGLKPVAHTSCVQADVINAIAKIYSARNVYLINDDKV